MELLLTMFEESDVVIEVLAGDSVTNVIRIVSTRVPRTIFLEAATQIALLNERRLLHVIWLTA